MMIQTVLINDDGNVLADVTKQDAAQAWLDGMNAQIAGQHPSECIDYPNYGQVWLDGFHWARGLSLTCIWIVTFLRILKQCEKLAQKWTKAQG